MWVWMSINLLFFCGRRRRISLIFSRNEQPETQNQTNFKISPPPIAKQVLDFGMQKITWQVFKWIGIWEAPPPCFNKIPTFSRSFWRSVSLMAAVTGQHSIHHIHQLSPGLQWSFQCQPFSSSFASKSALRWKFLEIPWLAAWSKPSPATSFSNIQTRQRKAISSFRKVYKQQAVALMDMIIQVRICSTLQRNRSHWARMVRDISVRPNMCYIS